MDISEISQIVKHHRKIAGLTQVELGRLAGVGKTAVFDLEHQKATIRFDVVRKILGALNISLKPVSPLDLPEAKPRSAADQHEQ